jgi:hypothetical protein
MLAFMLLFSSEALPLHFSNRRATRKALRFRARVAPKAPFWRLLTGNLSCNLPDRPSSSSPHGDGLLR